MSASFRSTCTLLLSAAALSLSACKTTPEADTAVQTPTLQVEPVPPKVALALGGGAARGFAHVGVIKMLESHGIVPDIVVGTSAGCVVGALYAAGHSGFKLQEMTFDLDRAAFADFQWFGRGLLKGEALENFVNDKVGNRRMEDLPVPFACVAVRLSTGEAALFRTGNIGGVVRASSAIPGVFMPPVIGDEEYVDGGLASPVPVRAARQMGADIVIAVDISNPVADAPSDSTMRMLLKTFAIMGNALKQVELPEADVVIAPDVRGIAAADFESKQRAILEGERAALSAVPQIKSAVVAKTRFDKSTVAPQATASPSKQ